MKCNVYLANSPIHDRALQAFSEGVPQAVDTECRPVEHYEPSEVAVVFGVAKTALPFTTARGQVINGQRERGLPCVVLETGYIHRGDGAEHYYAAGLGGLNGWADFRNADSPCDRWEQLGLTLKPYPSVPPTEGYALLCGQVPWDASVQHTQHDFFLFMAAELITRILDLPIVFRPHPKAPLKAYPAQVHQFASGHASLENDLVGARLVVVYNSNVAVDALVAGVPAVVLGAGDMVGLAAYRRLHDAKKWPPPERRQWACDIAYTQWTLQEMREGLAWNHLLS